MVRIKYNEKSIVAELAVPSGPLMKGISIAALSVLLSSQDSFAAQIDVTEGKPKELSTRVTHDKPPLLRLARKRHLLKIDVGDSKEDGAAAPTPEHAVTLSLRLAIIEEEAIEFVSGIGHGVPVLQLDQSRLFAREPSVEGVGETFIDVSSVSVEMGSPSIMSPVLSPVDAGFRPGSAPARPEPAGAAAGTTAASGTGKSLPRRARARRMSATAMLAPAQMGRSVSGGIPRPTEDDRARVISFDGGGYRGLLSAAVVWRIQAEFNINLPGSADLLAGTSAGGLNALGYATGMDPEQVVEFYRGHGSEIFSSGAWRAITSASGMTRAKYGRRGVDALLQTQFKELRMGDLRQQVVIPALDVSLGHPVVYSAREARENPHKNFKVRDVAASTSAAPSFFGVAGFEGPDGGKKYMADGGLFANNPIMAATSELSMLGYDPRKAVVLSIGTGEVSLARDGASMTDAGALKWGPAEMIKLIMASGQKFAHDTARGIYGENYTRLQAELDEAHASMDDTSDGQTDYLMSLAARMVDEKHDRLEQVVRRWDGEAVPIDMGAMD